MVPDQELLRRFVATRDQSAFAELVARHVHAMYGAARRVCPAEADDVTQAAFVVLAQKAHTLGDVGNLSGWLYRTTLAFAANARRISSRRLQHEREASMERSRTQPRSELSSDAPMLALLDELLPRLPDEMREAVLVRHIEGRTPDEAATLLGITIDAAAKRASRGVAMLRELFAAKGVAVPVAAVATLLATQSANAAPAAVVTTATAAASSGVSAGAPVGAAKSVSTIFAGLAAPVATISLVATLCVTAWLALGTRAKLKPFAAAPVVNPASQPASPAVPPVPSPEEESLVPGDVMLAQLGMIIDGATLDELVKVTDATESPNVVRGTAADIVGVLRKFAVAQPVIVDGGADHLSSSAFWVERGHWLSRSGRPIWRDFRHERHVFTIGFAYSASIQFRVTPSGTVELKIDDPNAIAFSQEYSSEPRMRQNEQVPLKFTGAITPGEAFVVFHEFPAMRGKRWAAAYAYQAYRVTEPQRLRTSSIGVNTWLREGPAGARALADRAIRWGGNRKLTPDDVPVEWTRKLANGVTVRLMGISRPAKWPFCWWDPTGKPNASLFGSLATASTGQAAVHLNFEGVEARWNRPTNLADAHLLAEADPSHFDVWVGAGDFNEQPFKVGDEVKIGVDSVIRFREVMEGDNTLAVLEGDAGPDVEFTVDAILKDGERVAASLDEPIAFVTPGTPRWSRGSPNLWVKDKAPIDHFVLRWRKRERAHFEGYKTTPVHSPDAPD